MEILSSEYDQDLFIVETINMLLNDFRNASADDKYKLNDIINDLKFLKRLINNNRVSTKDKNNNYGYKSIIFNYITKFENYLKILNHKELLINNNLSNNFILSLNDISDYLNNIYILISLN